MLRCSGDVLQIKTAPVTCGILYFGGANDDIVLWAKSNMYGATEMMDALIKLYYQNKCKNNEFKYYVCALVCIFYMNT